MGANVSTNRINRVVFLGLDNSGKTGLTLSQSIALLKKLTKTKDTGEGPTICPEVYSLKYRGVTLKLWDVPGNTLGRDLWVHHLADLSLLCFVVDLDDSARFQEAAQQLTRLDSSPETRDVPFIVIGNKSELAPELTPSALEELFPLSRSPPLASYVLCSALMQSELPQILKCMTAAMECGRAPKWSLGSDNKVNNKFTEN